MGDIKLFRIKKGQVEELHGAAVALEKSLQTLIEANLEACLGVRFLATEFQTGRQHGGRIDTLGIDEDDCPVIIEFKRASNENVINQGLFYLDWLLDHRADFELLVVKTLGKKASESIDWTAPRLLCIAGDFTHYDEYAVKQIERHIELIRYRRFGDDLLLFEVVNVPAAAATNGRKTSGASKPDAATYKHITKTLDELEGPLLDLFGEVEAFLLALGDDVQKRTLKFYFAFKRIKNFACVEIHKGKQCLTCYVKVDPSTVTLEKGFTRDVRDIGHFGTGDLEITLRSSADIKKAAPLFQRSYEAS